MKYWRWLMALSLVSSSLMAQQQPPKSLAPAIVPVNTPNSRGTLLFREDFSAFPDVSTRDGHSAPGQGGLDVSAEDGPMYVILWDRGRLTSNVRMSVTVQIVREGRDHNGGGITWGVRDRDSSTRGNSFAVTPDGRFQVTGAGPARPVPAVHRGEGATNTLVVQCTSGQALLMVNGVQVSQLLSETNGGYVGVFASRGSRVVFSNLRVERIN